MIADYQPSTFRIVFRPMLAKIASHCRYLTIFREVKGGQKLINGKEPFLRIKWLENSRDSFEWRNSRISPRGNLSFVAIITVFSLVVTVRIYLTIIGISLP